MLVTKENYLFIEEVFYALIGKFKIEEEQSSEICPYIKDFILYVSDLPLMEVLLYRTIDYVEKDRCGIRDIHLIINDKLLSALTNLVIKNVINPVNSFEEFLISKKVAGWLTELKDVSMEWLKKILSENSVSSPLVEVVGYLHDEAAIDWLISYLHHDDPLMRMAAIKAISEIGGQKAVDILTDAVKEEKHAEISALAESRLQRLKSRMSNKPL